MKMPLNMKVTVILMVVGALGTALKCFCKEIIGNIQIN